MKKLAKGCLYVIGFPVVGLVTLIVLFYVVENWKGARAWEEAVAVLESAGETVDWNQFTASIPPVREADNFAALPMLDALVHFELVDDQPSFLRPAERERFLKMTVLQGMDAPSGRRWEWGVPVDLEAWRQSLVEAEEFAIGREGDPAEAILNAISQHCGEELEELVRAAGSRPEGRFLRYQELEDFMDVLSYQLPESNPMIQATKLVALRGVAAVAAGNGELALESIDLGLRFAQLNGESHHLIGALVGNSQVDVMLGVVWEGLRTQVWTEAQLDELETKLEGMDPLKVLLEGYRGELAGFTGLFRDYFVSANKRQLAEVLRWVQPLGENGASGSRAIPWMMTVMPDGWIDQNAAQSVRYHLQYVIEPLKSGNLEAMLSEASLAIRERPTTPYNFIYKIAVPTQQRIGSRFVKTSAQVRMARIACALELAHLRAGSYPVELDTSGGAFPMDPLTGEAFRYQLVETGRYRIWSPGIDGVDGGGEVVLKGDGKRVDPETGDWVWSYSVDE